MRCFDFPFDNWHLLLGFVLYIGKLKRKEKKCEKVKAECELKVHLLHMNHSPRDKICVVT